MKKLFRKKGEGMIMTRNMIPNENSRNAVQGNGRNFWNSCSKLAYLPQSYSSFPFFYALRLPIFHFYFLNTILLF